MKNLTNFIHEKLYCTVGDISICGIFDAGFFFTNKLTYEPHLHSSHEMHIISSGKYIIENLEGTESTNVERGMIVLIPPKYYHNTVLCDQSEPEKFSFRLEFEQIKEKNDGRFYNSLTSYLKEHENNVAIFTLANAVENIKKIGEFMSRADLGDKAMATAYFKLFMTELIVEMIKNENQHHNDKFDVNSGDSITKRTDKINHLLAINYSNPSYNVNDFASELNLSERQANRVVMKLYGMTFHQMLTQTRLNCAVKLLKRTNISISSISEMVGYDSSTGFFIAFKKKYGVAPGQYRTSKEG